MRDIDDDLLSALNHNQVVLSAPVAEVLLQLTGENDERDWHWLVKLENGKHAYITGGCDCTGWDCQSNCEAYEAETDEGALRLAGDVPRHIFEEMRANHERERRGP